MKIGLSVTNASIEAGILPVMQEIGYTAVDYSLQADYETPHPVFAESRDVWTAFYEERKKLFASYGLTVTQTHATFSTDFDVLGEVTDKIIAQYEKEIEATAIMGAKLIVIHPICLPVATIQKEKERALNLKLYRSLIPALQKFGVKVGVENMYGHDYVRMRYCPTAANSTPEDLNYYLDQLGTDCFTVCVDTGHANMINVTPDTYVRALGNRLGMLHVNDNNGIRDEHNAPYMGNIDWTEFMKALKETGYDGSFSIEQATSKFLGKQKGVGVAYLRYTYNVAKSLLGEM